MVCTSAAEVAEAIRSMVVRGAPAIGIAAAYGIALAARRGEDLEPRRIAAGSSRPTAVNLGWALDRMRDDRRRSTPGPSTGPRSPAAGRWRRTRLPCSNRARAR